MDNINISMTTFVDFAIASGPPQLTIVRKAKREYGREYDPQRDFCKPLRESLYDIFRQNGDRFALATAIPKDIHHSKLGPYQEAIDGLKKWWGRKDLEWSGNFAETWRYDRLTVRVNPELVVYRF